jgi:hypothetical protein
MTIVRIRNSGHNEVDVIQQILTASGFGRIAIGDGDLLAFHPDDLTTAEKVKLEQALIDSVGMHLAVTFQK